MKMNYFVFDTNNMQEAMHFYDVPLEGSGFDKMHAEGCMTV